VGGRGQLGQRQKAPEGLAAPWKSTVQCRFPCRSRLLLAANNDCVLASRRRVFRYCRTGVFVALDGQDRPAASREDGTFSREDFTFCKEGNVYICPAFKTLTTTGKIMNDDMLFYRASTRDCVACPFKMRCCPKEPSRKILRSIYEEARDVARALAKTAAFEQSRRDRKRVEMLFTLAAIAQNLRRLAKLMARPPPAADACVA
jgi:DDE family transposase